MANQNTNTRSNSRNPSDRNNPADERQHGNSGNQGNPGNQKNARGQGQQDPKAANQKGNRDNLSGRSERDRED